MKFMSRIFLYIFVSSAMTILCLALAADFWNSRHHLEDSLQDAQNLTRLLAFQSTDPVLLDDRMALTNLYDSSLHSHKTIAYIFLETDGRVVASTLGGGVPKTLLTLPDFGSSPGLDRTLVENEQGELFYHFRVRLDRPGGTRVHLGLSSARVGEELGPLREMLALCGGVLVVLIPLALAWFLARSLSRPILLLRNGVVKIGQGELDQRLDIRTGDEIEQLAAEFNAMAQRLSGFYATLEQKVEERTRELENEIAGHRLTEAELRTNEARYRKLSQEFQTLLDGISDSITLLSPDLEIVLANRSTLESLYEKETEIIGKKCFQVWHGRSGPCEDCPGRQSFRTGRRENGVKKTADGKTWGIKAFPVADEAGRVINVIQVASDITENLRLQAEALRAGQLASLGELAAGVAHEINNPINGIINYAQILVDRDPSGGPQGNIAGEIIEEGSRIADIVRSLLSFARDQKREKTPVPVEAILSSPLALTRSQLGRDGIRLDVDDVSELPHVMADKGQIQQVVLNLISNARYALNQKYPDPHEDKGLEIHGEAFWANGHSYVRLEFCDHGTGIRAEHLDKIMDPFFSTKPGDKGTGLGLSLSHGIVKDHEGRMTIDSLEGKYTRVTIELPAEQAGGTQP